MDAPRPANTLAGGAVTEPENAGDEPVDASTSLASLEALLKQDTTGTDKYGVVDCAGFDLQSVVV